MTATKTEATNPPDNTRTLVIEKEFPHPPQKLWRALTESDLLAQWLLGNDFQAALGHKFHFQSPPQPQWDGIISCEILALDPPTRLSYTWSALGLETVVLFTLTPTEAGTQLRMEQSGFPLDYDQAYNGANYGWQRFLGNLEQLLGNIN